MDTNIFDISKISPILENLNTSPSHSNCYLFLLFFIQRVQHISHIIHLIHPFYKNSFKLSLKYCLIHETNYTNIIKKINEFRKDYDKIDLINDLLQFIRNSIEQRSKENELALIDPKTTKNVNIRTKLLNLAHKFNTLEELVRDVDEIEDEIDFYDCLNANTLVKLSLRKLRLEREVVKVELEWESFLGRKGGKELYDVLKGWFQL